MMLRAVLIVLALLIASAPAAQATFPGRNGDLLVTNQYNGHSDPSADLMRIDPRSGEVSRTTICAGWADDRAPQPRCYWAGPPAVSPDGGSVAFAAEDQFGEPLPTGAAASIRVLSLATGQWTHISLPGMTLPYQTAIRFLPNGSYLVVTDQHQALLLDRDGTAPREAISNVTALDVSSYGDVAFIRREALRLRDPDGSSRRITGRGASRPSWSPHAKSVAYTYKGWVYTTGAGGGHPRRLTRGFEPAWSPDGRQIAFFRTSPSREYFGDEATFLYVLNRRTGRVRRVSSQLMALEEANDSATAGIDWQPAR